VSVQHPHTKLLNAAARDVLRPLGIVQKGKSRTWLDDRGWWLGVVEFQPSDWARGSYLNVGVHWLWNPNAHLTFDFGHRVDGLGRRVVRYESDEQFAPLARELAVIAAEKACSYRDLFRTLDACARELRRADPDDRIQSLNAGIALGLVGDPLAAGEMFSRYVSWFESNVELEWTRHDLQVERYERGRLLSTLAHDVSAFRERIGQDVREARAMLKLPAEVELPF
jgi:hypothetical protein